MTPHVLLEQLRNLLASMPPLEGRGNYTHEQFTWLGRAKALMSDWNEIKSIPFSVAVDSLIRNINRHVQYGIVVTHIHDVIARLENSLPENSGQAFGPGAAYDFFVALNDLVASANTHILIVDPYLDAAVFDGYLHGLSRGVAVRLLTAKYIDNVRVALDKHRAQFASNIEARSSNDLHDRIIFIDAGQCWVLGASIKDAALKKPTYLAPLPIDVAAQKRAVYEATWAAGVPI